MADPNSEQFTPGEDDGYDDPWTPEEERVDDPPPTFEKTRRHRRVPIPDRKKRPVKRQWRRPK